MWTKRWDRPLDDIFEVQDKVSQQVVAEVVPALKGKEHERIKTKSPASFTAWDHYLKGLSLFNVENRDNNIDEIIKLCDSAILLDDGFCDAYVLKCRCLYDLIFITKYIHLPSNHEEKFH